MTDKRILDIENRLKKIEEYIEKRKSQQLTLPVDTITQKIINTYG
jgi:hypothetical protein